MDVCLNRSRWLHLQLNNLTVSNYLRYFLMNICPTDNKKFFYTMFVSICFGVIVNNRNLLYMYIVDNIVVL